MQVGTWSGLISASLGTGVLGGIMAAVLGVGSMGIVGCGLLGLGLGLGQQMYTGLSRGTDEQMAECIVQATLLRNLVDNNIVRIDAEGGRIVYLEFPAGLSGLSIINHKLLQDNVTITWVNSLCPLFLFCHKARYLSSDCVMSPPVRACSSFT